MQYAIDPEEMTPLDKTVCADIDGLFYVVIKLLHNHRRHWYHLQRNILHSSLSSTFVVVVGGAIILVVAVAVL